MPKTKKCHYISQIYLKSWSLNGSSVKVYQKSTKKTNIISIGKNFYKNNLYNFKFNMLTYVKLFPIIYDDFREMIKRFTKENNITIFYDKEIFNIDTKNLGYLAEKEKIEFYKNSEKLSEKQKNDLYNRLSQLKSTILEEKFCELIENKWSDFLKKLLNKPKIMGLSEYIALNDDEMQLLRMMTISMLIKIENTPGISIINNTTQDVLDWFESFATSAKSKDNFKDLSNGTIKPLLFLKRIYDLLINKDSSQFMNLTFTISKLNYELYYINGNKEFYTSDIPCFEVINNFEATNKNNGIYFPLTPKLLLVLKRDEELSNTINVYEASDKEINYFNWLIFNNCNDYIIVGKEEIS